MGDVKGPKEHPTAKQENSMQGLEPLDNEASRQLVPPRQQNDDNDGNENPFDEQVDRAVRSEVEKKKSGLTVEQKPEIRKTNFSLASIKKLEDFKSKMLRRKTIKLNGNSLAFMSPNNPVR